MGGEVPFESPGPSATAQNGKSGVTETQICPFCGTEYEPRAWNQIYCRDRCRKDAWDREQEDKRVQGVKAVIMAMVERIVDEAIHQVYGEGASA